MAEEAEAQKQNQINSKPIRCIVKLGGAAITRKNKLETINEEAIKIVSQQLRESTKVLGGFSEKVLGMDWSKRPDSEEIFCDADGFTDIENFDFNPFIVVHGAGSFGHFQANKSGVHKGGLNLPLVKAGFVATRISVTSLNLEIVRALARGGIPSVGMSPFACGWLTSKRNITLPNTADISMVAKAIDSGFVPVLHGDAVFDVSQGCTILSGDVIISHLAAQLKPDFVVFLTDVLGVYDRPPTEPNAVFLREIEVSEDGSWTVVDPDIKEQVEMTVAAHDTTGGMATKISEAAIIAMLGIDVYLVKAATSHSLKALRGELIDNIPEDWLGTIIRLKR